MKLFATNRNERRIFYVLGHFLVLRLLKLSATNRKERGNFYALDLGGTNFRVLRLHVKGKPPQSEDRQMEEATIPSEIKCGTHEVCFSTDHLAYMVCEINGFRNFTMNL